MKLSDYLLFTVLLTPTLAVVAAAVVSLAMPDPAPQYHPPMALASSAAKLTTDE